MGHANLTNISTTVNHMLHHNESVSISRIVDELERKKQVVHASEGQLTERYMLSFATEEVIGYLYRGQHIEPVFLSRKQKKILSQWNANDIDEWDSGDEGDGGEYGIFDSIRWKTTAKKLPRLGEITN